jgi:hypothetical protein
MPQLLIEGTQIAAPASLLSPFATDRADPDTLFTLHQHLLAALAPRTRRCFGGEAAPAGRAWSKSPSLAARRAGGAVR